MFKKQPDGLKCYSTYAKSKNTEIVVWGSNFSSTVGMGRCTKQVKDMIQLPPYQKSVVIGLLLSDGSFDLLQNHMKILV